MGRESISPGDGSTGSIYNPVRQHVIQPTFRDMTAEDVEAGLRLCRASGWNQTAADWRALLAPPAVFRAALADGRVVGSAGAVVYGSDLAWVCMVLVDPAQRGRGLGTALVIQVLERLGPVRVVGLDATPNGRPVYARLGFAESHGLARLAAETPRMPAPEPDDVRPMTEADLAGLLAWDAAVFGADRSGLLRAARGAAPDLAWVLGTESIEGYCLGRPGHLADQVGPVVATSVDGARRLVTACLNRRPARRFFVDAPDEPSWRAELDTLGFREQRPFTRMYRTRVASQGRRRDLFAIFGPEFG